MRTKAIKAAPSKPVPRLPSTINKPLSADGVEVTRKLKTALATAKTGTTVGALIVALDQSGEWTVDLCGQLVPDSDTLCLIACRILVECVASKMD